MAAAPPVAVVNPADTTITGLAIGDIVNGNFRIRNDGNYPLTYYIPAYSENNMELEDPTIHKFGYVAEVNYDRIRIYFNYSVWFENPQYFIINFRHFLINSLKLGLLFNPTILKI